MKVTFSNGFELEVTQVQETWSTGEKLTLSIRSSEFYSPEELAQAIQGGTDTVTVDDPHYVYEGYSRIVNISSNISSEFVETNILLSK